MTMNSQYHFVRSITSFAASLRSQYRLWLVKALPASMAILRFLRVPQGRYCILIYFLLLTSYLLLPGCCGYSTRSLLPSHIRKVHVKIFENQTIKTGLDELATQTTIEVFHSGSSLRIVDEKQADIIIEGKVSGYAKDPYVYTGALNVTQYKITIKFTIRCVDQVKNTVFWEGDVSEWATCTTNEENGIKEAMEKTAQKLVTTILTNW